MIALLRGILVEKHPNQVILEAGGVGYDVTVPISTFSQLPDVGAETRLRIHTHVREDMLALYGFLSMDEKNLFEKLISVSNIGPSLAVKVLSGMAALDLQTAIRRNELEKLCASPASARKPPSASCWNCATSCPRPPTPSNPPHPPYRAWTKTSSPP